MSYSSLRVESFIGDAMNFSFTEKELFSDQIIPAFVSSDISYALVHTSLYNRFRQALGDQTGSVFQLNGHELDATDISYYAL